MLRHALSGCFLGRTIRLTMKSYALTLRSFDICRQTGMCRRQSRGLNSEAKIYDIIIV